MVNNTIVGCNVALKCYPNSPSVSNNIIAFNAVGVDKWITEPTMQLSRNNVFGNTKNYAPPSLAHAADISSEPMFVDRAGHNFHLKPLSPCIDAGDPSVKVAADRDFVPVPLDGNSDGTSIIDIGCYEYARGFDRIDAAKAASDGDYVALSGLVSSAKLEDRFYLESADRVAGIGVMGAVTELGKSMTVEGRMSTMDGERVVLPYNVIEGSDAVLPVPWLMNYNALGGGQMGLQSAVSDYRWVKNRQTGVMERVFFTYGGANNIGLLVKAVGKVCSTGDGYFYLDGAAPFDDGNEAIKGVRVSWPYGADKMPAEGSFVEVVGISSCTTKDGIVVRLLRPASQDSVRVLAPK